MVNMTLALPNDLHRMMKEHPEIRWSEVARQALWTEAKKREIVEKILSKSKLTEKDAREIGDKIKEGMAKRHGIK